MPFGKKDKKGKPAYPVQPAAYPVQQTAYYPAQAGYPPHQGAFQSTVLPQQGAYPSAYPQYQQAGAMPPQGPPPAYTAQPQTYAAPPPQYHQAAPPHMGMAAPTPQYHQAGASTVIVQGGFDAGARNPSSVPPPPPGYAENVAQMSVNQGHNVVLTQRSSNWMTGGSDGGYVVW